MTCAYCDKPLECAACRSVYVPPSRAHYEALSRPDVPLACPSCGATLVCHWCKTPYDGMGDGEAEDS